MSTTRNDVNPIARLLRLQILTSARFYDERVYSEINPKQIVKELAELKKQISELTAAEWEQVLNETINKFFEYPLSQETQNTRDILPKAFVDFLEKIFNAPEPNVEETDYERINIFEEDITGITNFDLLKKVRNIKKLLDDNPSELEKGLEEIYKALQEDPNNFAQYSRFSGDHADVFEFDFTRPSDPTISIHAFNRARQKIKEWEMKNAEEAAEAVLADARNPHAAHRVAAIITPTHAKSYNAALSEKTTRNITESTSGRVCATIITKAGSNEKEMVGHVEYRENDVIRFKTVVMPKALDPLNYIMNAIQDTNWPHDATRPGSEVNIKAVIQERIQEKYGDKMNRVFSEEDYKKFFVTLSRDQDLAKAITETLVKGGYNLSQSVSFSFIKTSGFFSNVNELAKYAADSQKPEVENMDNYVYLFRQLESLHARGQTIHLQNFTSPHELKAAVYFCKMAGFDYVNHDTFIFNDQFKITSQSQLQELQEKIWMKYKLDPPAGVPTLFVPLYKGVANTLEEKFNRIPPAAQKELKKLDDEFKNYNQFVRNFNKFKQAFAPGKYLAGESKRVEEYKIAKKHLDEERRQNDSFLAPSIRETVINAHEKTVRTILDKIMTTSPIQPPLAEVDKQHLISEVVQKLGDHLNRNEAEHAPDIITFVKDNWTAAVRKNKITEIVKTLVVPSLNTNEKEELVDYILRSTMDATVQLHLDKADAATTPDPVLATYIREQQTEYTHEKKANAILQEVLREGNLKPSQFTDVQKSSILQVAIGALSSSPPPTDPAIKQEVIDRVTAELTVKNARRFRT